MSVLQTEWTSAAIDKHDFLNSNINTKEKSNKRDDDEHTKESIDQQQHSTPTEELDDECRRLQETKGGMRGRHFQIKHTNIHP